MDSTVLPPPSPPVVVAPRAKGRLLTEMNLFLPAFPKRKHLGGGIAGDGDLGCKVEIAGMPVPHSASTERGGI
jgi:hypothetical protein